MRLELLDQERGATGKEHKSPKRRPPGLELGIAQARYGQPDTGEPDGIDNILEPGVTIDGKQGRISQREACRR